MPRPEETTNWEVEKVINIESQVRRSRNKIRESEVDFGVPAVTSISLSSNMDLNGPVSETEIHSWMIYGPAGNQPKVITEIPGEMIDKPPFRTAWSKTPVVGSALIQESLWRKVGEIM